MARAACCARRLRAAAACAAAALWVAACDPPDSDDRADPAEASMDSAAAHGRWSLRVKRRRDGGVVVRNGPVPMLPRGAVRALPRWELPLADPWRLAADSAHLYLLSRSDSVYVAGLPADAVPRLAAYPSPLGRTMTSLAVSHGTLAAAASTAFERSELRMAAPGAAAARVAPFEGMGLQVQGVDSGFVVNLQRGFRTYLRLVRPDGSGRELDLPGPPYQHKLTPARWLRMADDGRLVLANGVRPGFRSVALDGRIVREVLVEEPEAPPLPEWNREPYVWIAAASHDAATGLYALSETVRMPEHGDPDSALHLFTADGVFLATVRVPGRLWAMELRGGRVYGLVWHPDQPAVLAAFDLSLPAGALERAHAAYLRAGGGR